MKNLKNLMYLFFLGFLIFCSCSDAPNSSVNLNSRTKEEQILDSPSFGPHSLNTLLYHDYHIEGRPNSGISHAYNIPQLVIDTIGGSGIWIENFDFTTSPSELEIGGEKYVSLGTAGYDFSLSFAPINENGMYVSFYLAVLQGSNVIYADSFGGFFTPYSGGTANVSGTLNNLSHSTNTRVQFKVTMYPVDDDDRE